MSISEKRIREIEDKNKKILDNKIQQIISGQAENIIGMSRIGRRIGVDTTIPNMGITFYNKLNELTKEFKNAGISLFVETNENYDLMTPNFVGNAIISDMISQLSSGTQALENYNSSIESIIEDRYQKLQALKETGPIKKILSKIRSLFVSTPTLNLTSYSEEEISDVNSHLSEYREIDKKLWKYNLRDNLVESLVKYINDCGYYDCDFVDISELLEESVVPTLQKLGLEDLIPQLKEEISKAQEKSSSSDKKSWELSPKQTEAMRRVQGIIAMEYQETGNDGTVTDAQDKEHGE